MVAWTEVNDLNTARQSVGSGPGGSNTAALAFGGTIPTIQCNCNYRIMEWNFLDRSWRFKPSKICT